jgi:hypothetical protein
VNTQGHLGGVVTARVGPAGDESPYFVDGLPVEADRRHGRAVHVSEVGAVGTVFHHDLGMHRLVVGAPGTLRVGAIVGGRVGFKLRVLPEDVWHLPLRLLSLRLVLHEDALVLLVHAVDPQS